MSANEKSAVKVLVLCTGNICRSPVAEVVLEKMLSNRRAVEIWSAGVAAPTGAMPDPTAVKTAADQGYAVSPEKRSRGMTLVDIQVADLILVMELRHKSAVVARAQAAQSKTFLFGQWTSGEIADPIGRDEEFFKDVLVEIELAAKAWALRIEAL